MIVQAPVSGTRRKQARWRAACAPLVKKEADVSQCEARLSVTDEQVTTRQYRTVARLSPVIGVMLLLFGLLWLAHPAWLLNW